jgi:pantoate--beta-alanine ligase
VSLAVFERISQIHSWVISQRDQGHTIGFVPTMGALHAGHQSLIELATGHCDRVVASVFVNPTQFNNAEDLKKYPRTLEADLALLEKSGCHAVFCPSIDEMYEPGEQTQRWDFGALSNSLEGEFRPGHFDGVLTIVKKLFLATEPNKAFFGEKDFQQLAIIKRMTEVEKLPIEIIAGPTIRENNGLAMSSRNTRLSEDEKIIALHISRVLLESARSGKNTDPVQLENQANADLKAIDGLRLEYCSLVNASDFEPLTQWPTEKTVLLVAAFVGEVRLIDNVIIP